MRRIIEFDASTRKIFSWQIRRGAFNSRSTARENFAEMQKIASDALSRKTSRATIKETVPKTDTGGLVENTKANG